MYIWKVFIIKAEMVIVDRFSFPVIKKKYWENKWVVFFWSDNPILCTKILDEIVYENTYKHFTWFNCTNVRELKAFILIQATITHVRSAFE